MPVSENVISHSGVAVRRYGAGGLVHLVGGGHWICGIEPRVIYVIAVLQNCSDSQASTLNKIHKGHRALETRLLQTEHEMCVHEVGSDGVRLLINRLAVRVERIWIGGTS